MGVETPITTAQVQLPATLPNCRIHFQTIVTSFVLGETSAVPLFTAMYNNAEDKAVRTVTVELSKMKCVHSAFAWEVFDELLEKDFRTIGVVLEHSVLDSGSESQV